MPRVVQMISAVAMMALLAMPTQAGEPKANGAQLVDDAGSRNDDDHDDWIDVLSSDWGLKKPGIDADTYAVLLLAAVVDNDPLADFYLANPGAEGATEYGEYWSDPRHADEIGAVLMFAEAAGLSEIDTMDLLMLVASDQNRVGNERHYFTIELIEAVPDDLFFDTESDGSETATDNCSKTTKTVSFSFKGAG